MFFIKKEGIIIFMVSESESISKSEVKTIRESIESMSNTELAHYLLIFFKKTFKKLFDGKNLTDPVYQIMNYVIRLDNVHDTEDYSDFEDILLDVSWSRSRDVQPNLELTETVDIKNRRIISILLLYKLINVISKNIEHVSNTELEYLTHIKIIYELYLSDSSLSTEDVVKIAKTHQSYELFALADELLK